MGKNAESIPVVIDNVRRIFQAINEYSRSAEQTTGLTGTQLWVLKILANSAPMRVSELAHQMYLSSATVVGIIDRLEVKNMVTRKRSKKDRRAVDLDLTKTGKEMVINAPEVAQIMLIKGLGELSENDFSVVETGMQQMVHILRAEQINPQPMHS